MSIAFSLLISTGDGCVELTYFFDSIQLIERFYDPLAGEVYVRTFLFQIIDH